MRAILIFLFCYPLFSFSQVIDRDDVKWVLDDVADYNVSYNDKKIEISDSIVEFTIEPNSSYQLWWVGISNKGAERIWIQWNEAVMGSYITSKVVFGDMMRFEMSRETPEMVVYKNSFVHKQIAGYDYLGEYVRDMIWLKDMKKQFKKTKKPQITNVTIIIPIRNGDDEKIYKFMFTGEYSGKQKK